MNLNPDDIQRLWKFLTPDEKKELARYSEAIEKIKNGWTPLPGPQSMAFESKADILFYGGAAGGGKTDLALGKALNKHKRSLILRREFPQLAAIQERSQDLYDTYGKYIASPKPIWRVNYKGVDRVIGFDSCQYDKDKNKFQGRPHDLRVLDEASNFLESQAIFLGGWVRSEDPNQECQLLLVSNPPTGADGQWLFDWFAAWLDERHPNPAAPGELRWYARVNNEFVECEDSRQFVIVDNQRNYDFDPNEFCLEDIITPKSRTYIPARVTDNPHYVKSGYIATLQALDEPLRSQMLKGDFAAGRVDDAWQVIPTGWVKLAQERWKNTPKPETPMWCVGVDPSRGGIDKTVITLRWGAWFAKQIVYPGKEMPDSDAVIDQIAKHRENDAFVTIDVIGIGAAVYDGIRSRIPDAALKLRIIGFNASEGSQARDKSKLHGFRNQRSQWYWFLRYALDPQSGLGLCLPDDQELLADLCAPRYEVVNGMICVEPKEDIKDRIGRSPDKGDSLLYAFVVNNKKPPHETYVPHMGR